MPRKKRLIDSLTRRTAFNMRALLRYRGLSYRQLERQLRTVSEFPTYDASSLSRYFAIADLEDPSFTSLPLSLVASFAKLFKVNIEVFFQEDFNPQAMVFYDQSELQPNYHIVDLIRDDVREYARTSEKHERAAEVNGHPSWMAFDFPLATLPKGGVLQAFLDTQSNIARADSSVEEIHRTRLKSNVLMKNVILTETFEGFLKILSKRKSEVKPNSSRTLAHDYLENLLRRIEQGRYLVTLAHRRRVIRAGFQELLRFTAVVINNDALVVLRSENNLVVWSEHPVQVRRYGDRVRELISHVLPVAVRYNDALFREHSTKIVSEYLESLD